jgi:hypothetical protein
VVLYHKRRPLADQVGTPKVSKNHNFFYEAKTGVKTTSKANAL